MKKGHSLWVREILARLGVLTLLDAPLGKFAVLVTLSRLRLKEPVLA